jgi:hypothetical protein
MKRITILCFAACAPSVPATPSYQQDVAPILAANCIRCHGVPVLGGAPADFRLDAFGDYERPARNSIDLDTVSGAAKYSLIIAQRVDSSDAPMPPRFPIDDYQIETLQNWADAGAPRGAPNQGNRAPTAAVTTVQQAIEEDGVEIRVRYLIDLTVTDADADLVGGGLLARQGATVLPLGLVHSGPNRVAWETTNIVPGTFAIDAVLDDGAAETTIPLGSIVVEAP